MAEIPIERKPRRSVSPLLLILLLIVIVGAAWYWWTNMNSSGSTTTSSIAPVSRTVSSIPVPTSYISHLRRV